MCEVEVWLQSFCTSALPEVLSASRHGRYSPRRKDQNLVDATVGPDVGIRRLRRQVTLLHVTSLKPKNHHVELLILQNILMVVSAVGG